MNSFTHPVPVLNHCQLVSANRGSEAVLWPTPAPLLDLTPTQGLAVVVQVSPIVKTPHQAFSSTESSTRELTRVGFGEFRILFLTPLGGEPSRGDNRQDRNVACFVVGQHQNRVTTLGIGNPHRAGRSLYTCEPFMLLPDGNAPPSAGTSSNTSSSTSSSTSSNMPWFLWFAIHPRERLLTCGVGTEPNLSTTRAMFPLTAEEAKNLEYSAVGVSNWKAPIRVGLVGMRPAPSGFNRSMAKFNLDGHLVPFPGNTIVCHIPPDSPHFQGLVQAQNILRNNRILSPLFGFLPPSSFHMTVCELNSSIYARSDLVPPEASWETCHAAMKTQLSPLLSENADSSFAMVLDERAGILVPALSTVCLQARDFANHVALTNFRKQACARAGFEYNDQYQFHITLCYLLLRPIQGTQLLQEFQKVQSEMKVCLHRSFQEHELRLTPTLTWFEDMGCFHPY